MFVVESSPFRNKLRTEQPTGVPAASKAKEQSGIASDLLLVEDYFFSRHDPSCMLVSRSFSPRWQGLLPYILKY